MLCTRGPRPQQDSTYTTCSTQRSHPSPDGDTKKSEPNFGKDVDGGFLFTSISVNTARTFQPNGQETAAPVDACATEIATSSVRGQLRPSTGIITIVVTGIITIAQDRRELETHRRTVDEKNTLSASGRSAFATITNGRTFQHNISEMTMLVNSGGTENFPDDELFSGLKERIMNPTLVDVPKTLITAGNKKLLGIMTGTITAL